MKITRFDSLSDLVSHVESLPVHGEGSPDFSGGTFVDAKRLAAMGWPEGARRASAVSNRIADRVIASRNADNQEPVIGQDVCGAAYDPGAYASGVPECWSTLEPAVEKRAIRIVVNAMASGSVSNESIVDRGVAVAGLVLALQSRGYVVTVDVCQVLTPDKCKEVESTIVRVIDGASGSPLDVDRLVYAIAHPTVLRVLFANTTNGYRGRTCSTRWGSGSITRTVDDAMTDGPCDLYLEHMHADDSDKWAGGGEKWVLDQFNRQTAA